MHPFLSATLEAAAGLLYPPACAGCDVALEPGHFLCAECDAGVRRVEAPFCAMCSQTFGQTVAGGVPTVMFSGPLSCPYCRERPPVFECAVGARRHEGLARDLIARFKYKGEHHICRPLAGWLAEALRDDPRLRDVVNMGEATLVPVPLHPGRQRERGFNQAESLCRALARETGLPTWNALRRVRYTRTQTELDRDERRQNLHDAIAPTRDRLRRRTLQGVRVVLVDDVFTTGATVNECARALRRAGAKSVRVLTVARR